MKFFTAFLIIITSLQINAQNVGIGIANPSVNLQVDSVIKIGKNQAINTGTPGRVNALRFGDGPFVTIGEDTRDDQLNIRAGMVIFKQSNNSLGNGGVGIGVDSATAGLDIGGTFRLRTAGTPGTGKVLTSDANGNATWESPNKSGIYTVGGTDFRPERSDVTVDIWGSNGGAYYTTPTNSTMVAPIHLPDGVRITQITFYVLDNVADDIYLRFSPEQATSTGYLLGVNTTSSGAASTIRPFTIFTNITIDNANNSYLVGATTQWSGTNTTSIKSVVIRYEN